MPSVDAKGASQEYGLERDAGKVVFIASSFDFIKTDVLPI